MIGTFLNHFKRGREFEEWFLDQVHVVAIGSLVIDPSFYDPETRSCEECQCLLHGVFVRALDTNELVFGELYRPFTVVEGNIACRRDIGLQEGEAFYVNTRNLPV